MRIAENVSGFFTPYAFETISVPAATNATAQFGAGMNGVVTVTAYRPDGNSFSVVVTQATDPDVDLAAVVDNDLLQVQVTLGTDSSGDPDDTKNTATLVAAAIDALTDFAASASGTGATVITATTATFSGGTYSYTLTASKLTPSSTQTDRDLGKARLVLVQVDVASIRYTIHGAAPQVTGTQFGHLAPDVSVITLASRKAMTNFKAIAVSTTAKLQVTYLR